MLKLPITPHFISWQQCRLYEEEGPDLIFPYKIHRLIFHTFSHLLNTASASVSGFKQVPRVTATTGGSEMQVADREAWPSLALPCAAAGSLLLKELAWLRRCCSSNQQRLNHTAEKLCTESIAPSKKRNTSSHPKQFISVTQEVDANRWGRRRE